MWSMTSVSTGPLLFSSFSPSASAAVKAARLGPGSANGALAAIDRCKPNLKSVESVPVDGGYTGQPFADSAMQQFEATVQAVKRNWSARHFLNQLF